MLWQGQPHRNDNKNKRKTHTDAERDRNTIFVESVISPARMGCGTLELSNSSPTLASIPENTHQATGAPPGTHEQALDGHGMAARIKEWQLSDK
jgi:hypothetical protein